MMKSIFTSSPPLLLLISQTQNPNFKHQKTLIFRKQKLTTVREKLVTDIVVVVAAAVEEQASVISAVESSDGADVVKRFYGGINSRDISLVEDLIAENCVYEDLVFPRPFVGRKAILDFFNKFVDAISGDLQFVIDDISDEDSFAVGVTWHLEWKGRPFPFSKGCSFYRLELVNGRKQIIYARDSVEPSIKPGETALVAIRGVTWLLQKFPQLADRF
ncbi:hypothetical protein GIB67_029946 [Kingdonia uniflora]|uniref:SnoaL-like domain-containing protein n=1 Tax=Kingdonia uniflora TaxID=39325 RepID=A0A7J7MYC7_9MAGN|nr:hypothetical protein GIB67_029946 [Kingdonia uniflora]